MAYNNELKNFIYIYHNQLINQEKILKRHPYSTVVIIKTTLFKKSNEKLHYFLNKFKESSFDFQKKDHTFKFKKLGKNIIIRFPFKNTDNLSLEKQENKTWRDACKILDQILDFDKEGNKIYVLEDEVEKLNRMLLIEEAAAKAEYHKKQHEKKQQEIHNPNDDIKYAKQKDINRIRFALGDALFRDKIKKGENLFHNEGLHYDNEYLYEIYVEPFEKKKTKKK